MVALARWDRRQGLGCELGSSEFEGINVVEKFHLCAPFVEIVENEKHRKPRLFEELR